MTTSAIESRTTGLREQKRLATLDALIHATRSLAAEHGYSRVTVEQICAQAGVSRRTFFNYFPSKDDAFLGRGDEQLPADLVDAFRARRAAGTRRGELSASLVDDLVDLMCDLAERAVLDRDAFGLMVAAIDKDPGLLVILRDSGVRSAATLAELIAEREGVPTTDARIQMATAVLGIVAQRSIVTYFEADNLLTFGELFRANIAATRALFTA